MKKYISSQVIAILFTSVIYAQVQIDKPIQLTGGTGQRSMTNLETPVNGTDAVNKDYVDNKVAAGGGSTISMVSAESTNMMHFGDAVRYCKNLNESGYIDWRLPSQAELLFVISHGGAVVSTDASSNYIWVTDLYAYTSFYASNERTKMRLSDGFTTRGNAASATEARVRCVR